MNVWAQRRHFQTAELQTKYLKKGQSDMVRRQSLLILCPFILLIGTVGRELRSAPQIDQTGKHPKGADAQPSADIVARRVGSLEGVRIPFPMTVEGNDLFVVNENHVIHVYSIEPFAPKFTFGRKGDGPEDFQYVPHLWVFSDTAVISDFIKSLWFTRSGAFIKALKYSDFPDFNPGQEMQLFPVGNLLVRNIVDHKTRKRSVILLDSQLQPLKMLYEGLFDWNQVGGRRSFNLLTHRIEVAAGDDKIFISDTEKGFFIQVFDTNGDTVGTIDLNAQEARIPVSAADKERLLEEVRLTRQENVYVFAKANASVPEAFPRIHQIRFSGGRLYITTHREKRGLHEMLVLDYSGKVLNRLFLPLKSFHHFRGPFRSDLFTVSSEVLYELIQNPETQSWELFRSDLAKKD